MVVVTLEAYKNAQVHTITVGNKELFWVKIKDVQNGLGVKCISDLLRKEMLGIFYTKNLTKEHKMKYIRSEYQLSKIIIDNKKDKYARSDITEKVIENCRGIKKSNDGANKLDKENQRQNFRTMLGFKEIEIYERKTYSIVTK